MTIKDKTPMRLIGIIGCLVLILSSCVPSRKYQELQTKEEACLTENNALKGSNERLTTEVNELKGEAGVFTKQITALQRDTTILGDALRHLRGQYDKINELNDILMSKNTAMMADVTAENRKLLTDLQTTQSSLQKKEDALRVLENEINQKTENLATLSAELKDREQRVNELEDLLNKKDEAVNDLKKRVSEALLGFKDKGLTVEQKNGKVYVSLEAKLLFPSGSTVIDQDGKKALIDLAKAIENQQDLEIIVEGHTDTDKLRSNTIPRDNWELSVLRATAVVKIMTENSTIDPKILSASGRSEYLPVDPDDKARNRRIEIILAPNLDELFELIQSN